MHRDSQPGTGSAPAPERLPGGGVGGAVRIGSTVHRPAGPWSDAVHRLLDHLHGRGLDGVPRAFGFEVRDGQRVEMVSYLPGECAEAYDTWPDWAYSEALIAQVMTWTRRFHDAVRDFRPAEPLQWRSGSRQLAPDEIICHHDIAPYNVIVDTSTVSGASSDEGVRLVGVIDWDMAGPGEPLEDLAHAAWNFLPPRVEQAGNSPLAIREIAERLRRVVRHYGAFEPAQLLAAVGQRMERSAGVIRTRADAGDAGMRNLVESGRLEALEARIRWWRAIADDVRAAL